MPEKLNKETFDEHVGSTFEVKTESGAVKLELAKVTDHSKENLESFSALFRGPKDKSFDQGTYKVSHGKLGELQLFLVPVVNPQDDDKNHYEFVVSRLKE